MTGPRVFRFGSRDDLVRQAAAMVSDRILGLQTEQSVVHLCLSGGRVAYDVYALLPDLLATPPLKPDRLHLWFSSEYFISTDNPDRVSLQTLSRLARGITLSPTTIHLIPSSDAFVDPESAALAYAHELSGVTLDICLLELHDDGHIASLFPGALDDLARGPVSAVTDVPGMTYQRVTLTPEGIQRSKEVWVLAAGQAVNQAVHAALEQGSHVPAALTTGAAWTCWLLDGEAAAGLPFHDCRL